MKKIKSKHFWSWFIHNQDTYLRIFSMPRACCQFWLDELHAHVAGYQRLLHAQLYLDNHHWKKGQLVISANGCQKQFKAVEQLVAAAPSIPGWEFFSLQPPLPPDAIIGSKLKLLKIQVDGLLFSPRAFTGHDAKIELQVYSSCTAANDLLGQSVIERVVFNLLGERIYGERIAYVIVQPLSWLSPSQRRELLPLNLLPDHLGCSDLQRFEVDKNGLIVTGTSGRKALNNIYHQPNL